MKYRFAVIAVLGMLIMTGCGHDYASENVSEAAEVSASEETFDNSAEETSEKNEVPIAADDSEIPDGAAYKCTEYIVLNDTPTVRSISYCDEYGNDIRTISYWDDEILAVADFENEYDGNGRLVSARGKTKSFSETFEEYFDSSTFEKYADSSESESFVEIEYYENGEAKKMSSYLDDEISTTEWTYEYDEQGRPVVKYEYWDGSDELFSTIYITYDENGNLSKAKVNYKGKMEMENTYQYDEKGRVVKNESSMSKSSYFTEYEYEDYKDFTIIRPNGLTY